jgi:hypothetical protein
MASNNSIVLVGTLTASKTVALPPASSVPGRILYIKDIVGNSALSTITISCPPGDTIDKRPYTSTVLVSTGAGVVKLASDGQTNWMVLSYYNLELGIPPPGSIVPPPPPPGPVWSILLDGDGFVNDNGGGSFTCSGPNDSGGQGWSYIYAQFTTAGSFTYNYSWFTSDGIFYDWPFEIVSATDPASNPGGFDFFNSKIATTNSESGSRTVSYGANDYVLLGVFSSDSCCGNGICTFSGLPV